MCCKGRYVATVMLQVMLDELISYIKECILNLLPAG